MQETTTSPTTRATPGPGQDQRPRTTQDRAGPHVTQAGTRPPTPRRRPAGPRTADRSRGDGRPLPDLPPGCPERPELQLFVPLRVRRHPVDPHCPRHLPLLAGPHQAPQLTHRLVVLRQPGCLRTRTGPGRSLPRGPAGIRAAAAGARCPDTPKRPHLSVRPRRTRPTAPRRVRDRHDHTGPPGRVTQPVTRTCIRPRPSTDGCDQRSRDVAYGSYSGRKWMTACS